MTQRLLSANFTVGERAQEANARAGWTHGEAHSKLRKPMRREPPGTCQ
jgi:hypothetical protein